MSWFKKDLPKLCRKCEKNPVDHPAEWYCHSCQMEQLHEKWLLDRSIRLEKERLQRLKEEEDLRLKKKQEEALDLAITYLKENIRGKD